jgi:fucose 4-O-acetylase-like acetyltransferase
MVLCHFFFLFGDLSFLIFLFFNLIQRLINNKTYEEKKKNKFMSFLEMDMIKICWFVVRQVVLESKNNGIFNEEREI